MGCGRSFLRSSVAGVVSSEVELEGGLVAEVAVEEVDGRRLGRSSAPARPRGSHPLNLPETRAGLEVSVEAPWRVTEWLEGGLWQK